MTSIKPATATVDTVDTIDQAALRPALRPVEAAKLPPGRKILQYFWWQGEFEPGTALLWREQVATRRAHLRATGRMRHNPDKQLHKTRRQHIVGGLINHVNCPDYAPEFDERWPAPAMLQ